jgi:hypothetical protein
MPTRHALQVARGLQKGWQPDSTTEVLP